MQRNTQVPVGKHNNRQHASPHHEVATDVKQMPIRPIIIIYITWQRWVQRQCATVTKVHLTQWRKKTQKELHNTHIIYHIFVHTCTKVMSKHNFMKGCGNGRERVGRYIRKFWEAFVLFSMIVWHQIETRTKTSGTKLLPQCRPTFLLLGSLNDSTRLFLAL